MVPVLPATPPTRLYPGCRLRGLGATLAVSTTAKELFRTMSPLKRSNNIAARMGRWSASHWKTAVFGWLAFVVAAVAVGMTVTTKQIKTEDANVGQSHRADQILKKGFPQADPQTELVVVQSATKTVDDPAFRATVDDVVRSVKGDPATKNFKSPLTP